MIIHHHGLHSNLDLSSGFAATRLQAKYKGYKVKGEFRKQKEAGKYMKYSGAI